jgi:signal peptidase I
MAAARFFSGPDGTEMNEQKIQDILSQKIFKGKIISASMAPLIKVGDEVVVEVKARDLKRFDIIIFVQNNQLVCHYIWALNEIMKPRLLQTRSLAGVKDLPISEEDYIGRVISHRLRWWHIFKIILLG